MNRRQTRAVAARLDEQAAARELNDDADRATRLTARLFGWCPACGEQVDDAQGRKHHWECPDAPPQMRNAPPEGA